MSTFWHQRTLRDARRVIERGREALESFPRDLRPTHVPMSRALDELPTLHVDQLEAMSLTGGVAVQVAHRSSPFVLGHRFIFGDDDGIRYQGFIWMPGMLNRTQVAEKLGVRGIVADRFALEALRGIVPNLCVLAREGWPEAATIIEPEHFNSVNALVTSGSS